MAHPGSLSWGGAGPSKNLSLHRFLINTLIFFFSFGLFEKQDREYHILYVYTVHRTLYRGGWFTVSSASGFPLYAISTSYIAGYNSVRVYE
jgi:hypothetical protein